LQLSFKKVTKLSDLKGMKIRGTSPQHVEVAKALGATAVQISPTNLYTSMERGTIDGMLIVTEGIFALKVSELVKYPLWEPVASDIMAVVMDLKVSNSLSPEVRVIIQDINEEMKYWYVETCKTDQENQERTRKVGIEIYKLDPGEKAALHAALEPVTQNWVEKMEGRGIPAKKVDNEMRRILKQY
jgi:TRAP-type C4-dicarboxylate transport system substrate-binding protein